MKQVCYILLQSQIYYNGNENSRDWCFAFTSLNIKIITEARKTKQCSKQTCLQIIVLLKTITNAE